jgi:tripartite ATP-independent transporter DctP family solute receptor
MRSQLGEGATVFADEVAKRTGGKITLEQMPNSTMGGELEMLKGLQQGTVDMAFITGAPLPNILPEAGVFNIPFIFRDLAHAHAVLDSPFGQAYLEKFKQKNVIALAWGENGMRHITNSKRPIQTPEDLKGLKLRLPQSDVMMIGFKAMGADVQTLAFPLVYNALQSGLFDGQENPIATILSSKFGQVQKYLTLSGHVYDPAVFLVSKDVWGDLTKAEQEILVKSAQLGAAASRRYAFEAQQKGVDFLRQQGVEIVDSVDRASFVAALQSAQPQYEKMFGRDVLEEIAAIK